MSTTDSFLNLKLKSLCGFEEGRFHATFSDNSSLIVQSNNNYLTYFFSNGEKIRIELKTTPNRDDIKSKVYDALKKNNMFNLKSFVTLLDLYPEEERTVMVNKVTFCTWPLQNESVQNSLIVNQDGSIIFKSTDGLSQLKLLNNGMIFEVDYLQILPNKKPMWVNKILYEEQYEQSYSFTRDFLSSIENHQNLNKEKHTLKMGYEYIRMKKIYSIFNFPPQWSYPLLMCFEKYEALITHAGYSVRYRPIFNLQFLEWLESLQEDIIGVKSDCTGLGIMKASDDTLLNEIPIVSPAEDMNNLKRADIWTDDNINPLAEMYLKDQIPHHQLYGNFIIWLTNTGEALIWIQDDDSVVISTQEGKFFTHFHRNMRVPEGTEESMDNYEFKFSVETAPPVTRSKKKTGISYALGEVVKTANNMVNKCKWFVIAEPQTLQVQPYKEKEKEEVDYRTMPFELCHQSKNGYGFFEAFKNRSIKVVFMDRTVLRINFGQEVANILTKSGDRVSVRLDKPNDFEYYVKIAMEYYENVFTDPEVKLAKFNETLQHEQLVGNALLRNEVLLAQMTKELPRMDISRNEMDLSRQSLSNSNIHEMSSMKSTYLGKSQIDDYFDIDEINQKVQERLKANQDLLENINKSFKLPK